MTKTHDLPMFGKPDKSRVAPDHQTTRPPRQTTDHQDKQIVHQDIQDIQASTEDNITTEEVRATPKAELEKQGAQGRGAALFADECYRGIEVVEFVTMAYDASIKIGRHKQSPMWEFSRYLKARPEFLALDAGELLKRLATIIELTEFERDIIAAEWSEVRFAAGMKPLEWATGMAKTYPLRNPPGSPTETYKTFTSIAAWLQVLQGDKPIQLPVKDFAEILRSPSHRHISKLRQTAMRAGLLIEIAPSRYTEKLATDFRFAVEKFPELSERQ
jgi:hypothetical protein